MTSAIASDTVPLTHDEAASLLAQTMGLVSVTAGTFALGAYAGRNASGAWAVAWYVFAFVLLLALSAAGRRGQTLAVMVLLGFGLSLGLAVGPTIAYYAGADPQAVWEAGGATALLIAGCGAIGYALRRDLSQLARGLSWALLALIAFGIVLIFVQVPGGELTFSIVGLVVFVGLTLYDFQRLRATRDMRAAPLLAASIFLDGLNVFLFFLSIFGRDD